MSIAIGIKLISLVFIFLFSSNIYCGSKIIDGKRGNNSIQSTINIADEGDTLFILKGIYKEGNIIVDKPLVIIGRDWPVIDGENKYEIFSVTGSGVFISGLKFINSGVSYIEDNAAVKLDNVSDCNISGNIFEKNFFAVYLAKSSRCKIENNRIKSLVKSEAASGNGIHLWYCKDILINNNTVKGHRDGIYLEFVENSTINNNHSEGNLRYGLHFMFSDSCTYSKNNFVKNGAGVAVMYTHNVEMTENIFEHNWGGASYGILLKEITDSRISDNYFYRNSSGIYIEGSNRVVVEKNDFIENGWAVRLMANSIDNYFYQNDFIGNSFDVATNSIKNNSIFENNYWSSYRGYDIDRDNIGDIPYRPVKLFSLIVERNRPTLILLRSMFIDLLDTAEDIFPILTPETLVDNSPAMKRIK